LPLPHEVVKRVAGRAYRYQVESYRDAATGKVRGRWTYVGRVTEDGTPVKRRTAENGVATRERLLEALADLLEREEFAKVTAGRVADAAGVAHGTFYRYFKDKRSALNAIYDLAREELDRERPSFETELATLEEERARIRRWVETALRSKFRRAGSLRAWYALVANEPEFRLERNARRATVIAALADYFARLDAAGLSKIPLPFELASALAALFEGIFRVAVLETGTVGETLVTGAIDLFDRAIFVPV
jgi:AcrR family transcriptional regulator